jgi:hypothetical protein
MVAVSFIGGVNWSTWRKPPFDLQLSMRSVSPLIPAHDEIFSMQHYVLKLVSDFRQVGGFLQVLQFTPPMKLTATAIKWKSDAKRQKQHTYKQTKQIKKNNNKQNVIRIQVLLLSANSFILQKKCYRIRDFDITDVINSNDFGPHK